MDGGSGTVQTLLIHELTRGHELLGQLLANLDQPTVTNPCKQLASEILLSIERALCIAKASILESPRLNPSYGGTDSSVSPRSESSEQASKELERREMSKKRKTLPKWTNQVLAGAGERPEGPADDGYSWRKYGQKEILGAKHPRLVTLRPTIIPLQHVKEVDMIELFRGYYRCTHRNTRGCLATKQVQRSDQNPSILDITYRGDHTCHQKQQLVFPHGETEQEQSQEVHPLMDRVQPQHHQPELLLSFQTGLRVRTTGSCIKTDNMVFSSPLGMENCFNSNFSPSFISSAASESNFGGANPQGAESDYKEIVTAASSAVDSPFVDMDFMLGNIDFDPDFHFDASAFFV
uniref:Transcription factor WRKY33 n=1 Tax=Lilium regale TaxID=82328 RepID=A0A894TC52_LILRE|nr:transcription factor WRKY33 [Lilium regale]